MFNCLLKQDKIIKSLKMVIPATLFHGRIMLLEIPN
jgi:hypothetical protein